MRQKKYTKTKKLYVQTVRFIQKYSGLKELMNNGGGAPKGDDEA